MNVRRSLALAVIMSAIVEMLKPIPGGISPFTQLTASDWTAPLQHSVFPNCVGNHVLTFH